MMVYICVKFHQSIWNDFQLTERIFFLHRNSYVQCLKDNNSKSRQTELRFMCFAHRLIFLYICVNSGENILDQSYGANTNDGRIPTPLFVAGHNYIIQGEINKITE